MCSEHKFTSSKTPSKQKKYLKKKTKNTLPPNSKLFGTSVALGLKQNCAPHNYIYDEWRLATERNEKGCCYCCSLLFSFFVYVSLVRSFRHRRQPPIVRTKYEVHNTQSNLMLPSPSFNVTSYTNEWTDTLAPSRLHRRTVCQVRYDLLRIFVFVIFRLSFTELVPWRFCAAAFRWTNEWLDSFIDQNKKRRDTFASVRGKKLHFIFGRRPGIADLVMINDHAQFRYLWRVNFGFHFRMPQRWRPGCTCRHFINSEGIQWTTHYELSVTKSSKFLV